MIIISHVRIVRKENLHPNDNSAEIVNPWLPEGGLDGYIASNIMEAVKPRCCCGGDCR